VLLTASTLTSRWLGAREIARRMSPATQIPSPTIPAADELQPGL
jgi:hypothetical protein